MRLNDKFNGMNKVVKYILSVLLALVLLYFSFRGVEWEAFFYEISHCRWGYVLLAMAASAMAFWFRGLRWRGVLLPFDASTQRLTTFNAVNIGYLANFVFPRIGEFVRCGVIVRNGKGITYDKVLGTVVLERLIDLLSMILFFVVLLSFSWARFGAFVTKNVITPLSESLNLHNGLIIVLIIALIIGLIVLLRYLRDKSRVLSKTWSVLKGLGEGFASLWRMKDKWRFYFYTAVIWILYWIMAWAILRALPSLDSMNAIDALFICLVGGLGWLVPVPGGFGAFHYIVALAFSTVYGLEFDKGLIVATLSHEAQAITMIVFGLMSYVWEAIRNRNRAI